MPARNSRQRGRGCGRLAPTDARCVSDWVDPKFTAGSRHCRFGTRSGGVGERPLTFRQNAVRTVAPRPRSHSSPTRLQQRTFRRARRALWVTTSCSSTTADRATGRSTWISRPALPGQETSPYCSLARHFRSKPGVCDEHSGRLDQRDRPVHTHPARAGRQRAHQDRRSHGCRREPRQCLELSAPGTGDQQLRADPVADARLISTERLGGAALLDRPLPLSGRQLILRQLRLRCRSCAFIACELEVLIQGRLLEVVTRAQVIDGESAGLVVP